MSEGKKRTWGGKLPAGWPVLLAVVAAALLLLLVLKPEKESADFFNDPVADAQMAHSILIAQIDAATIDFAGVEIGVETGVETGAETGAEVAGADPELDLAVPVQAGMDILLRRDLFKPFVKKTTAVRSKPKNPVKKKKGSRRARSPHKLSAILIDGAKRQAFFGGHHLVEVGDEMHGCTIIAITDSSATLLKGGKEIEIKMGAK